MNPAPAPIIFPQIADGNGFVTEIVVLSAGASSALTLTFFDDNGRPLQILK
jgi:hypothetical protein